MPTLYELSEDYRAVMRMLDDVAADNDGVIPDDLADTLDTLEADRDAKIANTIRAIRNVEADAQAFADEANRLQRKAKTLIARADWLRNYLGVCVGERNTWQDDLFAVSWSKSQRVEVDDIENVPEELRTTKVTIAADKTEIKRRIKAGQEVPGAHITDHYSLRIK